MREGGREGGRETEGGRREREGYQFSLSLPADVAANWTLAADVDTTRAPSGLNLSPCQRLG